MATIRFRAKAEGDTGVGFDFDPPRWSDVLWEGTSLEPVPSPAKVTIGPAMTLHGQVALEQRGPAGTERWYTPLYRDTRPDTVTGGIEVYQPYPTTLLGVFAEGTDVWGTFTVTLTGMIPGTYDIRVKSADTLSNLKIGVTLPTASTINFGTLLVGDGNGDDLVDAFDVSYMVPSFLLCWGDAGFRPYADTNRDGCVNGADVSALIPNFLKAGPVPVHACRRPGGCLHSRFSAGPGDRGQPEPPSYELVRAGWGNPCSGNHGRHRDRRRGHRRCVYRLRPQSSGGRRCRR